MGTTSKTKYKCRVWDSEWKERPDLYLVIFSDPCKELGFLVTCVLPMS